MQSNAELALILVPLFAFAEACIGIGLLISGAFLLAICTALFSSDIATLQAMVPLAMAGAILGDHVGFYTGVFLGPRLHHLRLAEKNRDRLARAESMIRRQGAWAIFIGRFIPAIRSLIPAALGISGFDRIRYSLLDLLACLLWSMTLGGLVWALDAGLFQ